MDEELKQSESNQKVRIRVPPVRKESKADELRLLEAQEAIEIRKQLQ